MNYIKFLVFGTIILLISMYSISYSIASPDENSQILYAEKLFEDSLYEPAIVEFKRFIFYNHESNLIDYAYYRIGHSFYNQKKYDDARRFFRRVEVEFPESPLKFDTKIMIAKSYFRENKYPSTRNELQQILTMDLNDRQLRLVSRYLQGWCYLYEKSWYLAIVEFRRVNQQEPNTELGKLSKELADLTLSGTQIPKKSPSFAKLISRFIPGSGQIYAGKFFNGLGSMLINGTFFYLLFDSIYDRRYVDAFGIYMVGSRFYYGNVYNAEKFAIEYNQRIDEQLINSAMNKHRSLSIEKIIP